MKQATLDLGPTVATLSKEEWSSGFKIYDPNNTDFTKYIFLFVDLYTFPDDDNIHMKVYGSSTTPSAMSIVSSVQEEEGVAWRKFGRLSLEPMGERKWKVFLGSTTLATITMHTVTLGLNIPQEHNGKALLDLLSTLKHTLLDLECV